MREKRVLTSIFFSLMGYYIVYNSSIIIVNLANYVGGKV